MTKPAVAHLDRCHEPVAEHDHEDGAGAQQVDAAVAFDGRGSGEVAHGGEVHAHSVACRPPCAREYVDPARSSIPVWFARQWGEGPHPRGLAVSGEGNRHDRVRRVDRGGRRPLVDHHERRAAHGRVCRVQPVRRGVLASSGTRSPAAPSCTARTTERGLDPAVVAARTEGPFAEVTEQVGGFYQVETDDLDDLLDCCQIIAALGDGIEVRRVVSPEDRPREVRRPHRLRPRAAGRRPTRTSGRSSSTPTTPSSGLSTTTAGDWRARRSPTPTRPTTIRHDASGRRRRHRRPLRRADRAGRRLLRRRPPRPRHGDRRRQAVAEVLHRRGATRRRGRGLRERMTATAQDVLAARVREEWGRLVSLLLARFRRLDLVEDALADAVETAASAGRATGSRTTRRAGCTPPPGAGCSTGCGPRRWPSARCRCSSSSAERPRRPWCGPTG